MNYIMRLIAIILAIVFASTVSFAFQNEPDGFRGIKWGSTDEVGGKRYKLTKEEEKFKTYKRNYEDYIFYRDGVEVKAAGLRYYTFESKFMKVRILCKISDWDSMKKILISLYGSPTKDGAKKDAKFLEWTGQKTNLLMINWGSAKPTFTVDLFDKELLGEYLGWKESQKSETGGF